MKLATYKDGSRDGQLLVVSRDLHSAHFATGIASRMQQLLDDWNFVSPQLEDLYLTLNQGKARHAFAFDARQCMAPLPRAYQWAEGSAYLSHVELLARARGGAAPAHFADEPLMVQGSGDELLGPRDDARFADAAWGIDFQAALAVVTGDVAMGTGADAALDSVRLLMLANGWSLRHLMSEEMTRGSGLVQSKTAPAFGPVAVTPDELGTAWRGGRVHLRVGIVCNGKEVGQIDAGAEMAPHFGQLIAHLARTRNVRAGSIIGSGALSQQDAAHGDACIAERRARESLDNGLPVTEFMAFGDTLRIEATDTDGLSVFGAIEQRVMQAA